MNKVELVILFGFLMGIGVVLDFLVFKDREKLPIFLSVFTVLALIILALLIVNGYSIT